VYHRRKKAYRDRINLGIQKTQLKKKKKRRRRKKVVCSAKYKMRVIKCTIC
jgi:hypothetical protein